MKLISILFFFLLGITSYAETIEEAYKKGLKTESDLKLMINTVNALKKYHWVEANCFRENSNLTKLSKTSGIAIQTISPKLDKKDFTSVDEVDTYFTGLQPEWYNTRAQVYTFLQEVRRCLKYSKEAFKVLSKKSILPLETPAENKIRMDITEFNAERTNDLITFEKNAVRFHEFFFSAYLKGKSKEFRSDLVSKQKDDSFKDLLGTVIAFETLMHHLDKIYSHIESVRTLKMNIDHALGRHHTWILGPKSDELLKLVSEAYAYYNSLPDRMKPTQPAQKLKTLLDSIPQYVTKYKEASKVLTIEESHKFLDHQTKQLLKGLKIRLIDSDRLGSLQRTLDRETDLASRLTIMFDIEIEARTLLLQIK